jgi:hypothetical protein
MTWDFLHSKCHIGKWRINQRKHPLHIEETAPHIMNNRHRGVKKRALEATGKKTIFQDSPRMGFDT